DADLKDFALGDYLSVDSSSDDDSINTAVSVTWKKAATPEDRAEASKTWDLPRPETAAPGTATSSASRSTPSASSPPREAGDDRPVLRRKDPEPADKPPEVAAAGPPKASPKEEEPDNSPPPT